jgi:hypothetical protein
MGDTIFSKEAEKSYYKLKAAKAQFSETSDTQTANYIIDLMKKFRADIEKTGDSEYMEKANSIVVAENNPDTETIKKGISRIILCAVIAIAVFVGVICYSVSRANEIPKNIKEIEDIIRNETTANLDGKLGAANSRSDLYYFLAHYDAECKYDITGIDLYMKNRCVVTIKIDASYDEEKYDNESAADEIALELKIMFKKYTFTTYNGWEIFIAETSTVNGEHCEDSSGDDMLSDWEGTEPYKEENYSWKLVLFSFVVIIVLIVIVRKNLVRINQAKLNLQGKTILKYVKKRERK